MQTAQSKTEASKSPSAAFNDGFYACLAGVNRSDSPAEMAGDVLRAWRRGWDYCQRGTI